MWLNETVKVQPIIVNCRPRCKNKCKLTLKEVAAEMLALLVILTSTRPTVIKKSSGHFYQVILRINKIELKINFKEGHISCHIVGPPTARQRYAIETAYSWWTVGGLLSCASWSY